MRTGDLRLIQKYVDAYYSKTNEPVPAYKLVKYVIVGLGVKENTAKSNIMRARELRLIDFVNGDSYVPNFTNTQNTL